MFIVVVVVTQGWLFKWLMFDVCAVAMNKDQWDPEFLKAIPIMKTRSGMQVEPAVVMWRHLDRNTNVVN